MSLLSSIGGLFRSPSQTETASTQAPPPALPDSVGGHSKGGLFGSFISDQLLKPQEAPIWAGSPFDTVEQHSSSEQQICLAVPSNSSFGSGGGGFFGEVLAAASKLPQPAPVNTPPLTSALVADLKKWEGQVGHMYQDKKGLVTTGIGNLLPNATAAKKLPWTDMSTGLPATSKQIDKAFADVAGAATGGKAEAFEGLSTLRLDTGVVNNLAAQRLENEFLPGLRKQFQHFESYPLPAQRALVDMAYSLGMGGLAKFENLHAACEAGDFAAAATECHRKGGREERNAWTSDLFAKASRLTEQVG